MIEYVPEEYPSDIAQFSKDLACCEKLLKDLFEQIISALIIKMTVSSIVIGLKKAPIFH